VTPPRQFGRRALVTGGGQGIGRAIAERLAAEGATVLIADINAARAAEAAATIRNKGGEADSLTLDVSDPARVDHAAIQVGQLDVVVANAGIQTFGPVSELSAAEWDRVLTVNALGTLLTLQLAAHTVAEGGAVVTIASIQALLPNPLSANYAASKAAVLSLTKTFAAELAPRGVRVNAVAPGRINTGLADYASTEIGRLTGQDPQATVRQRLASNPLRRIGEPSEVAAVVAFLASSDASYVTGECIHVCGGDLMI